MEFDYVAKHRYSCRHFSSKKVSQKKVNEIISAGVLAPSSKNRQPWKIKILNEKEKSIVTDLLEKELTENKQEKTGFATAKIYRECSTVLLIYLDDKDEHNLTTNILSIGAFMENMCLKATDLQIDSLWAYDLICAEKSINQFLGITMQLISSLCLGYKSKKTYKKQKKVLEDVLL